ncbi:HNH endonuclease [Nocardioides sediminis]|uniref:HNH endonuclease n=1 Tax=Nocardioides sediminis TaxID=433648 RepID=UPI000D313A6F|nr:DUF222 domain-containing protein [Nocardioides sediminis]
MFDIVSAPSPDAPAPGRQEVLCASNVEAWAAALSSELEGRSGLADGERVDTLRALERLACVVTAAQAHLARDLDESQRAAQAEAGLPAAKQGVGIADQVARARRESPHRGRQHLGLAKVVARELPHTWAAWRAGRITEWKATIVARETACLSLADRMVVDEVVAGDPSAIEVMGDRELAGACLEEVARLDAAALVARRRRAESERGVTLRPAPDTMTYLTALLPVKDGVAVFAALTRAADAARASGDERSRGQVMADALVERVRGGAGGGAGSTGLSLGLVMTDSALFGSADDPAHLDGFGPIPAELAREIVIGACDQDERVWLRRLYASPATGELVAMDARGRRFRGSLARFVRLRDRVCRTPWCDAPIRHVDHARRHADDGPTAEDNAQGLCEACNYAKDAPGWRARPGPDGTVETSTPTGHTISTRPPTVAHVRDRHLPALTIDYVLAG